MPLLLPIDKKRDIQLNDHNIDYSIFQNMKNPFHLNL